MTARTWAPSLDDVAAYVTSRTVDQTPGDEQPTGTFNESTRPTDGQVKSIINGAVGWVTSQAGSALDATLYDLAKATAAMRAAGLIELTYPTVGDEVNTGSMLLKQAADALGALIAAQQTIGGTSQSPAAALLPTWSFPVPDPNGDIPIYPY